MPNHYEWLMQPIDVQFLQKPKPIPSLPFKQIWVIDNYLPPSIHDSWYSWRFNSTKWGRQNRVIRNDKMRHLYWGESIYINIKDIKTIIPFIIFLVRLMSVGYVFILNPYKISSPFPK